MGNILGTGLTLATAIGYAVKKNHQRSRGEDKSLKELLHQSDKIDIELLDHFVKTSIFINVNSSIIGGSIRIHPRGI